MTRNHLLILALTFSAGIAYAAIDVTDVPTSSPALQHEVFARLLPQAPQLVAEHAPKLKTEKDDEDTTARFVIYGLLTELGRKGSQEQKAEMAKAMAEALEKIEGIGPTEFLIEQLQYVGDSSPAPKVAEYLDKGPHAAQAVRTLVQLKPTNLQELLLGGLSKAPLRGKVAILQALPGPLSADQVREVTALLDSGERDLREAALQALSKSASPDAAEAFKKAAAAPERFTPRRVQYHSLTYVQSLAKAGQKDEAAAFCRQMAKVEETTTTVHIKGAALTTLAEIAGDAALPDLMKAADSDWEEVRFPALRAAAKLDGDAARTALLDKLKSAAAPEITVDVLTVLGYRKDPTTLDAVLAQFASEQLPAKLAAINAASQIDRGRAIPQLMKIFSQEGEELLNAAIEQLARAEYEALSSAIPAALKEASPSGQAALVGLVARRRMTEHSELVYELTQAKAATVRTAAFKSLETLSTPQDLPRLLDILLAAKRESDRNASRRAYVATAKKLPEGPARSELALSRYKSATPEQQILLLETLPPLGGAEALAVVREAAVNRLPEIKEAGIRGLSEWPTTEALPDLLKIAESATEEKLQVFAVRGLSRLAGELKDKRDEQMNVLKTAMAASKRPDEKKLVLSALGEVRTTDSLNLVAPALDQQDVAPEAAGAVANIVLNNHGYAGMNSPEALDALRKAIPLLDTDKKPKAEEYLKKKTAENRR